MDRALRAEALLAAHAVHREEVKSLGHHQEATRQVCKLQICCSDGLDKSIFHLTARTYIGDERKTRSARKTLGEHHSGLINTLPVILVVYLAIYYVQHSISPKQKRLPSWCSGPSHFTIPILSPFTSVVSSPLYLSYPSSITYTSHSG